MSILNVFAEKNWFFLKKIAANWVTIVKLQLQSYFSEIFRTHGSAEQFFTIFAQVYQKKKEALYMEECCPNDRKNKKIPYTQTSKDKD